jgi:ABC-type multidrug transport system fused ATPase/permease subunit
MWKHIRAAKPFFFLAIAFMVCESLTNLAGTWLLQFFFDEVLFGENFERFWPLVCLIGLMFASYSLLFTIGPHFMHRALNRIRTSMFTEFMNHIYRLPILQLQNERTGKLVYNFTNDLHSSAWVASGDPPRLAQLIASSVFIIAILGNMNAALLSGMVIFSILYIYFGRKFANLRKSALASVNRKQSDVIVQLEEGISSTREVIAFNNQEWEKRKYQGKFELYYEAALNEAKVINKQTLLSDPLKWGALIFVILYGGFLVLDKEITVGMFFVSYQFTAIMMESFNGIYQFVMDYYGKTSSIERIRAIIESDKIPDGGLSFEAPIKSIAFDNVTLDLNGNKVLKKMSLSLNPFGKTALVGPSGSGKTTVANLLLHFYEPTEGALLINGIPLSDIKQKDWLKRITIVFQEPYLFPDTVRNNLLFGHQDVTDDHMMACCKAMLIHDTIEKLPQGYETVIGERGVTLSGGERQRLALARALIQNKEILILDEATSALDTISEKQVLEQINRMRSHQITIMIAHRLSTVQNADTIVVIDQGAVLEQGTHDELMSTDSLYRNLVLKQEHKS